MTEKLAKWLEEWAGEQMQVVCESTPMKPGRIGVYRRGVQTRQEYPDGSAERICRFGIEICFWTQTQKDRCAAGERMDDMEEWVRAKDAAGELPSFEQGECWRAEFVKGFALKTCGGLESVFSAEMDLYVLTER